LPSAATLHDVLVAIAGATGTILGLVLSISLIVFQTTAERYERPRIVAFLLRERVGAAVVWLLAVSFLSAVAFLVVGSLLADVRPLASTFIAGTLGAGGVVALVTYRTHALTGYLPDRLFHSLTLEMRHQLFRAQRRRAGRSVEAHAQRVVGDDLETLEDMIERVVAEKDYEMLAAGLRSIGTWLATYLQVKRRFTDRSPWFPRRPVRLSGSASRPIADRLTAQGLLPATDPQPHRDWIEDKTLESLRRATIALPNDASDAWQGVLTFFSEMWQWAWQTQEITVADGVMAEVEQLAREPRLLQDQGVVEQLTTFAWVVVEVAGRGFPVTAANIVDSRPWERADFATRLPRLAAEQAKDLSDRILLEQALTREVVTPREWMVEDVGLRWQPLEEEHRHDSIARAYGIAFEALNVACVENAPTAPLAAEMLLRIATRALEHGQPVAFQPSLVALLERGFGLAGSDEYQNLRGTLFTATRRLAESGRWADNRLLLAVIVTTVLPRDRAIAGANQTRAMVGWFDVLFMIAHSYAWAEFKGDPDGLRTSGALVSAIADVDRLAEVVGRHFASTLLLPFDTNVKYNEWFQPLRTAAYELPDRYVRDGGIGYGVVKDHPSDLFRRSEPLGFSGDSAVEGLVEQMLSWRRAEIQKLIALLQHRGPAR
jgi:hypothetical protein